MATKIDIISVLGFIFQTIMKTENANFWILGSVQVH